MNAITEKDVKMKRGTGVTNDKITAVMNVNENEIRVMRIDNEDYISLTDLARYKIQMIPLML